LIFKVFAAFLRAGFLGFGGGAAIAPAIHKEAVDRHGWVDDGTFNDVLALSNTLPGPAAPQMAAVIGYRAAGIGGMLAAVSALVVPMAVLVVVLISWIFSAVGESADKMLLLKRSTVAVFPLVSAMLCRLMLKFYRQGSEAIGPVRTVLFSLVCLALLYLGVDNGFVILAMISLAITSAAPWPGWFRYVMAVPVAALLFVHSDLVSTLSMTVPDYLEWSVVLGLLVAGAVGLWTTPAENGLPESTGEAGLRPVLEDLGRIWSVVLAVCVPLVVFCPLLRSSAYLALLAGMTFTGLMTFGGGPVFIPLAIGLLAGPSSQIFLYTRERLMQYIAIVNALPSPIISKLSAISGWDMVQRVADSGTAYSGPLWLWASAGGAILVVAMVLPAVTNSLVAFSCLDRIKRSPGMKAMTKFILPVLMAIFLSVFISFMDTTFRTVASFPGQSAISSGLQCVWLFCLFLWLQTRLRRIPDPLLILGAVAYGIIVL